MKLFAILSVIFFCYQLVKWLVTGEMLLPGTGNRARRDEDPRTYWAYFITYLFGCAAFGYWFLKDAKLL